MDDLISRQAAIDAFMTSTSDGDKAEWCKWVLEQLPSAERRGRWVRTGEDGYCSVCKCDMPMFRNDWEWEYTETPYCPNCGAMMDANATQRTECVENALDALEMEGEEE